MSELYDATAGAGLYPGWECGSSGVDAPGVVACGAGGALGGVVVPFTVGEGGEEVGAVLLVWGESGHGFLRGRWQAG